MSYLFTNLNDRLSNTVATVTAVPLTIAGWVRRVRTATQEEVFTLGVASTGDHRFSLGFDASDIAFAGVRESSIGSEGISSGGALTDTVSWHHIAGVFTSATSRLVYIDGVAGTPNLANFTPAGVAVTAIGRRPDAGFWFKGRVAHFAVWSSALSGGQIASLAGGAVPNTIGTPVNYWACTADANDSAGTNNLTVQSGATLDADNPTLGGGGPTTLLTNLEGQHRGSFRGQH